MIITRRALLGTTPAIALAACTASQSTAGAAAIAALTAAIGDVTTAISSGNFTGAALADLQMQLAALNAQLAILTPSSTSSTISSVFSTVEGIFANIGTYLPSILSLLTALGFLAVPKAVANHPTAAVDPGVLASLTLHLAQLKAAAGTP